MDTRFPAPALLRVASYNIRKCVGIDRRRDPRRVLGVIGAVAPDIVALQEADRRLGGRPATLSTRMIAEVTGLVPVPLADNAESLGWHGNAMLIRADARVTAVERLVLPGLEPRGAVLVEAVFAAGALRVVAAHLGLMRSYRRLQLAVITAALHERADMPTVIMGDFNEWSPSRGLEPLTDGFEVHSPGRSFHAARPVAALDRIAVSRDLRVAAAEVFDIGDATIASDHLPVWADLALPRPEQESG